jgi:protease-4
MNFRTLIATVVVVLAVFAVPLRAETPAPIVAHIRLAGSLEEAPMADDPIFGKGNENLRARLQRIHKAKSDPAVKALYLEIDGMQIGWGKLDELRRAIADFRKSGKKVHAFLESGEPKDYLLALACDEVAMPESSWLMLIGLRAEITFYKGLFDKLGIKADMLQMGDFKGAAEPYTRAEMSPEFRKQFESVLDDYFEKGLVEVVAKSRSGKGLTGERVKKLIDGGPYNAKAALKEGLIDRVGYADDIENAVKESVKEKGVTIARDYEKPHSKELNLANPFDLLKLVTSSKPSSSKKPKLAVIHVSGTIVNGKSSRGLLGGESSGSTTIIEAIHEAETDKTVKGIVLRVDSPGGSALASDLIWNELVKCKKPIVASMSDTAASGGYYVSMGTKKIYAEPGTLTGSIGVVGGKIVIGGLENKVGLTTDVISRGANAGIMAGSATYTDSEKKAMTALMKETYDQFLTKAVEGRKRAGVSMTREKMETLAGGRVWTGRQAKAAGLVDELGTLEDAIAEVRTMANVLESDELEIMELPRGRAFLESFLDSNADTELRGLKTLPLLRDMPELTGKLNGVEGILRLRTDPVWIILPGRMEVR